MGRQRSGQCADEIAAAEFLKIEIIMRRGPPEPQRIDGFAAVSDHRPIKRDTDQGRGSAWDGLQPPAVHLESAAELDFNGLIGTRDLPGVPTAQPVVRTFTLPAVFNG